MAKPSRFGIVCAPTGLALLLAVWSLTQAAISGSGLPSADEPAFSTIVRSNLAQISNALMIYINNNADAFPPRLSMLYPDYISDPAAFWSPGDDDPCPTTIDNDEPNQINSTQVSFEYLGERQSWWLEAPVMLVQDNALSHNGGTGLYALTSDGRVEFYTTSTRILPVADTVRPNLQQIGIALHAYADDYQGDFPAELSMLYPAYISDPAVFWNPGDNIRDGLPTTIDNDEPDRQNSAQISYAYLGAGYTSACDPGVILLQDNSPSNNGGAVVNLLAADGHVETFVPDPTCVDPSSCQTIARSNLRQIARASIIYANSNADDYPTELSMLYREGIYNPVLFWNPGDTDPYPLLIDNDDPNQLQSTQISYAYFKGRNLNGGMLDVLLQDNSLANNEGLGVNVVTNDGYTAFFGRYDGSLPSTETARANLQQIGLALHAYADANGDQFPTVLSMLYPTYIADPMVFWNPGDSDPFPPPTTIDNDLPHRPNSAQISYEYLGASYAPNGDADVILVQDNSLSNNGGAGINILTADGRTDFFAFVPEPCEYPLICRSRARSGLWLIGWALSRYADEQQGDLPPNLTMLYPGTILRPTTFWHPNDTDPWPLTIDNDVPNQPNSAQISYEYLAAGLNLHTLDSDEILVRDNSLANNGGFSMNVLYADGHVDYVLNCNDPFADIDGDGDVDQSDFGVFQRCLSEQVTLMPPECECFDRPPPGWHHGDEDIDQDDYGTFQACASGADVLADPTCDDE